MAQSDAGNWYGRIARYLDGELPETEFLAFATTDGMKCEGYYFVGEQQRRMHGREAARPWFERCVALGMDRYWEHKLSTLRLDEQ